MKPLYKMSNEYDVIMREIEDLDEIPPDMVSMIEKIEGDINEKVANIGYMILNFEAEEKILRDTIDTLTLRAIKSCSKIETLKSYLKFYLEKLDMKKINTPLFDVNIVKNRNGVNIDSKELIPSLFVKVEVVENQKIDKEAIRKELEKGAEIPGASLRLSTRLDIRQANLKKVEIIHEEAA